MYDRSAILRAAHVAARSKLANNRAWRSYREALAASMKQAWAAARREHFQRVMEAEDAAFAAANPLPADVARQISDLRLIAGAQSFTVSGAENRRLILAEAEDIEAAARCSMITALETSHKHKPHTKMPLARKAIVFTLLCGSFSKASLERPLDRWPTCA